MEEVEKGSKKDAKNEMTREGGKGREERKDRKELVVTSRLIREELQVSRYV